MTPSKSPPSPNGNNGAMALKVAGALFSVLITIALLWTERVSTGLVKVREDMDAKVDKVRESVSKIAPELAAIKATTEEQHKSVMIQLQHITDKLESVPVQRPHRRR